MLDKFMGKDGYKHYASELDLENISEESINERTKFYTKKS